MFENRTIITGTLHLLSPLHIGTGDVVTHPAVKSKKLGDNKPVQIAAIIRDCDNNPILPRSTIKGLLRRLGEEHEGADADAIKILFGEIKDSNADEDQDQDQEQEKKKPKSKGRMGRLLIHGGEQTKLGDASAYPYSDARCEADKIPPTKDSPLCGEGVFIASQAAIDPALGVAADHKLYHSEMVAPGAQFQLKLVLSHRGKEDQPEDKKTKENKQAFDALMRILARLTHQDGVPCGSGQAEGAGRLRLEEKSRRVEHYVLGRDGILKADPQHPFGTALGTYDKAASEAFKLTCKGPFLVVDSSYDPVKAKTRDDEERKRNPNNAGKESNIPQIVAQRGEEGAPLMLPTGLAGVLRARARWLDAREMMRAGECGYNADPASKDATRIFNREGVNFETLTATERLFGINGFRGLLEITAFKITEGKEVPFTSVKLDSFSGAPIDNALFTTRAFVDTKLSFALRVKGRGNYQPTPEDTNLFTALKKDIETNGLMLGHGSAKGFGWFKACCEKVGTGFSQKTCDNKERSAL